MLVITDGIYAVHSKNMSVISDGINAASTSKEALLDTYTPSYFLTPKMDLQEHLCHF